MKDETILQLPIFNGFTISVKSSSNPSVIKTDSTIIPPLDTSNVTIVLSVKNNVNNQTADTLPITISVPQSTNGQILAVANSLTLPVQTLSDLSLPTSQNDVSISWSSSLPTVISNTGVVTRSANYYEEYVRLTATMTSGQLSYKKEF